MMKLLLFCGFCVSLGRQGTLRQKAEEFASCIRKLGALPKDALDGAHAAQPSKVWRITVPLGTDICSPLQLCWGPQVAACRWIPRRFICYQLLK